MFCPKCGNQISENSRFCGKCGYSTGPLAPAAPPDYSATPRMPVKKKKSGINWTVFVIMILIGLLIIGGGAAGVLYLLDGGSFDRGSASVRDKDTDDDEDEDDEDEDDDKDSDPGRDEDADSFGDDEDEDFQPTEGRQAVSLEYLEWEATDKGIKLTNYTGTDSYVVIPDVIEGKKVISLGSAFSGNVTVETLVLGQYFETLNLDWLSGCDALVRVEGPNVTSLTGNLTNDHVEDLVLPNLEYLSLRQLDSADGLRYLEIPNVEYICTMDKDCEEVYLWPASLERVVIPEMTHYRMGWCFEDEEYLPYEPVGCLAMESFLDYEEDDYEELECGMCYYEVTDDIRIMLYCHFFQHDTVIVNGVTYQLG